MKLKLKPIRDQVVVLLGATSGIGLETALYMVEKGARVVVVGRSQEGLNDALERVRLHAEASIISWNRGSNGQAMMGSSGMGGSDFANAETGDAPVMTMEERVLGLEADVTNFDQVKGVADQVMSRFGRIDTWVNCAAVSEWALFEDTTAEEFHRIIEVNLLGQTYGAMAALPYLRQQGGALIFVGSVESKVPVPYHSAYNASKHGILGLAETMRLEMQHTNTPVSISVIMPASIDTPLFDKARTKIGVEPNPIPPVYTPSMVAKAITYAATHPVRQLVVGDSGYMMTFMHRLAPTLTNNFLGAKGFRDQRSDRQKSAQAPDNLYHHISGYDQIRSDETMRTQNFSIFTWFATHPTARLALYSGLLAGLGGLIGWRVVAMRNARQRDWRYRLPREAKKLSRQATKLQKRANKLASKSLKDAGKSIKSASETVVALPVISSLPMFRKRTMLEKMSDQASEIWGAIISALTSLSISLPFLTRRKSMAQRVSKRISDNMPDITLPWNRQPSMADRITMAEQRKAAAERFNKISDKVMSRVERRVKKAEKRAGRAVDKVNDTRKDAMKAAAKNIPSKSDVKEMAQKGVVVRKQSFIERMPFGERRETIVERLPIKK